MFSLQVLALRFADTQQAAAAAAAAAAAFSQAAHQSKNPSILVYTGKQGGGATVLREGCDTVTRETCFSECKQLKKRS
jgi:hypothetical protein